MKFVGLVAILEFIEHPYRTAIIILGMLEYNADCRRKSSLMKRKQGQVVLSISLYDTFFMLFYQKMAIVF